MLSPIAGIPKIDTNELIKNRKNTLRHRIKLMVNKGEGRMRDK